MACNNDNFSALKRAGEVHPSPSSPSSRLVAASHSTTARPTSISTSLPYSTPPRNQPNTSNLPPDTADSSSMPSHRVHREPSADSSTSSSLDRSAVPFSEDSSVATMSNSDYLRGGDKGNHVDGSNTSVCMLSSDIDEKVHRFHSSSNAVTEYDPELDAVIAILSNLKCFHQEDAVMDDVLHANVVGSSMLGETLERLGSLCGRFLDLSEKCQQLLKDYAPALTSKALKLCLASVQADQHVVLVSSSVLHDELLHGCCVLANLCYQGGPELQTMIGNLGGVDVVINMLNIFAHDDLVQQFACGALGNMIMMRHSDNVRLFVQAGGIEAVVRAMERHAQVHELQEWAFRAIRNLCQWSEFRAAIVDAGGLTAIEVALHNHNTRSCSNSNEDGQDHFNHNCFCRQAEWVVEELMETVQSSAQ